MTEIATAPSDSLVGLLFLLAALATLGLVLLVERVKELRS